MNRIKALQIKLFKFLISIDFFLKPFIFLLLIFISDLGHILKFVFFASKELRSGDKILDAGAGSQVYSSLFKKQFYISIDFLKVDKIYLYKPDIVGDLEHIPVQDETFDAILCIQVLEHIKDPKLVLDEFYRILKKGGKLFLTAPLLDELHEEPYHFFNFTKYGLKELFTYSKFNIKSINALGGFFSLASTKSIYFISFLMNLSNNIILKIIFYPVILFILLFRILIICPIFALLDLLDKEKKFTKGYACYCIK